MKTLKKLVSCLLVLSMIASMFVVVSAEEVDQIDPQTESTTYYSTCTDTSGNLLNPYFVNGQTWVEENGALKMPAGLVSSFILFDDELATNRVEATFHMKLSGSNDNRTGIVFALTDVDGDHTWENTGADVNYYWAYISGTGQLGVMKMGTYSSWKRLGTETNISTYGIDASTLTLAVEWDDQGNVKLYANDILVQDVTDTTGTQILTGNLYGMLIRAWGNSTGNYSDTVSSFVADATVNYNVSTAVTPAEGGTVTGAGEYKAGTDATVTATANVGYNFAGWYNGETKVSADAAYTFKVTGNTALTAKFEKITYSIAKDADGNLLNTYFVNGVVWAETNDGIKMPADNLSSFLLFDNALTNNRIEATIDNITLSWSGDDRNGIVFAATDIDGDHTWANNSGSDIAYYWVCLSGKNYIEFWEMGAYQSWKCFTNASVSELGIDINEGITIAVEWDANGHIKVFANGILAIDYVDETPLNGNLYGVLTRRYANRPGSTNPETYTDTFTSYVAGGALATKDENVTVTVDPTDAGTVTGAGDYYLGQNVTLTATPNAGYSFVGWYAGEELKSSDATYTFKASEDVELIAKFSQNTYEITVTPGANGTVAGGGTFAEGTSATVTATANAGYKFVGWYVGEELKSTDAAYTFTVTADVTVVAEFEKAEYTVATDANGNLLTPHFVDGVNWELSEGQLFLYDGTGVGFLLFDNELNANRIETTMVVRDNESGYHGDKRYGVVFALTDYDGDNSFTNGDDVSYYWAFINTWGHVEIRKMGRYQGWTVIGSSATPISTITTGVNLVVEWDDQGHIVVYADGAVVIDITDTTDPLNGSLYGLYAVKHWNHANDPAVTDAYYTSFIAGKKTATITVTGENGTVTGGGTFVEGASVTVTATPDAGYKFAGWYIGEELKSSDATYTFTASENVELIAKFSQNTYEITVTPGENGTATGGGTFAEGAEVTVTATANAGYKFVGWYIGEELKSADAAYTFTAEANVELTAKFEKITYSVATDADGNLLNPVFVGGVVWVEENGSIKMPHGYESSFLLFDNELANNRIEATIVVNDNTFGDGNHRNGIVFALTDHDGDLDFWYGNTDVSYYWAFINDWGCVELWEMGKYQNWASLVDGAYVDINDAYGIDPAQGVTLAAEWDAAGNIRVFANGILVLETVDSTPLTGNYYGMVLNKWGNTQGPEYEYPYNAPVTSFVAGKALATKDENVTVTVDPTDAGTVTGAGDYYLGQTVTLTATPNEGYKFVGWYENGDLIAAETTITFAAADRNLTAKFEKNAYTVGATAGEGGTVSGAGAYDEGAEATVTATPDAGYRFIGWFAGEELKSADAAYTFTAEANVELTAKFIKVHTILVAVGEGGAVSGDGSYDDGVSVTLTVTVTEGYKFLGWYENGELISAEAEITFTATEDRHLMVKFEELPHFVTNTYEENVIDYTAVGNTITVDHDKPCSVGYLSGDKYVALTATDNGDGTYSYVVPDDVTEILLVVKGDANGDGDVNAGDYAWLNSALLGDDALTAKEQFVADINGDGQVNAGDYGRMNAILLGKVDFAW